MSGFLLDTSALLTLRDDEPGAARVSELLRYAQDGVLPCHGCFISLMEVFYRVWKDEGESAGREAYADCLALPILWLHESTALLERAASVKATHSLSLADAWIAAAALELDATLVHKDPEFAGLAGLSEERLPYK
ncbi:MULTISPECIES: PIN domain-containing protein [Methylomonas]|uniref:Ribonuclease VapC n=1 Tax=Methylomonas koyamae TaxID=702114 RepID=A0A177NSX7_9GAMM|nr:PIN domain-containing protein [Methylomonas koyamae]OAI20644.1 nuclease [Methylomonas koyamae]